MDTSKNLSVSTLLNASSLSLVFFLRPSTINRTVSIVTHKELYIKNINFSLRKYLVLHKKLNSCF